jgi:hypothetical protein
MISYDSRGWRGVVEEEMREHRHSTNGVVQAYPDIDIGQWYVRDDFEPGTRFEWSWPSRLYRHAPTLDVRIVRNGLTISYISLWGPNEGKKIRQRVDLSWSRCTFGGRRPWLVCTGCTRRVVCLYLLGDRFRCRHCHALTYVSQRMGREARAYRRAQKILWRLGGGPDPRAGPLERPPGMHWSTYRELLQKCEVAAIEFERLSTERCEKVQRRVDAMIGRLAKISKQTGMQE